MKSKGIEWAILLAIVFSALGAIAELTCLVLSLVFLVGYGNLPKAVGCMVVAIYLNLQRKE